MRSYKLRTRQDNDGKVSINIVHDKGSNIEQVKLISILSNEKGFGGRTRWRYVKNMLCVFIGPSDLCCQPDGKNI